ncbi:MAG: GIY-YIG nuclease family protein [Snowella sp.]|nr:GIY-YIG nuclease family protein [Snowella sp.]
MSDVNIPTLDDLEFLSYLNEQGSIDENLQGKIGVYAIFDEAKMLQFVGYSRDIYLSLKQHLVRQPDKCYWLKLQTIDRPSRTVLEATKQQWMTENEGIPEGKQTVESVWTDPIDAKLTMTDEDKIAYENQDELGKIKFLKSVARKLETEIQEKLSDRGVKMEIRFNPKLKEQGLLDLK